MGICPPLLKIFKKEEDKIAKYNFLQSCSEILSDCYHHPIAVYKFTSGIIHNIASSVLQPPAKIASIILALPKQILYGIATVGIIGGMTIEAMIGLLLIDPISLLIIIVGTAYGLSLGLITKLIDSIATVKLSIKRYIEENNDDSCDDNEDIDDNEDSEDIDDIAAIQILPHNNPDDESIESAGQESEEPESAG